MTITDCKINEKTRDGIQVGAGPGTYLINEPTGGITCVVLIVGPAILLFADGKCCEAL